MDGLSWGSPRLTGTRSAVASTHWLATGAAMSILDQGGTAFDAAVAAGFVLQVVEPHFNGLGGDVSIVLYSAATQGVKVICGQGPMPQAANIDHFRSLGLHQIPGSGLLPACVPGAFGAWMTLLAEYGTMHPAQVLDAAVGYAAGGFPLLPEAALTIRTLEPLFRHEWTESGRTYLAGGSPPEAGSRFRNPLLASTYQRILKEAQAAPGGRQAQIEAANAAFYQGFVAEAIDSFVAKNEVLDSTGRRHKGLLTGSDLAAWHAQVEAPVSLDFAGYTVYKPNTWSQGPVFLQELALLQGFDLAGMGLASTDYLHTVVECAKLALADREAWYGDPDHFDVPLDGLLSSSYADTRRQLIGKSAAESLQPGTVGSRHSWIPQEKPNECPPVAAEWMAQIVRGMPTIVQATAARADTCPIVIADHHGNLVAAVPSGGWLKSSPVIPDLGFSLGTRGQSMWLREGHPNSLAPGKRPRTTLSPTVVLRQGSPCLAFGTPGGDRQDQWTLMFFLALTQFGLDLQFAAETLTFHSDHVPASFTPRESRPKVLVMEKNCGEERISSLRDRGHLVEVVPEYSLGKVCAVAIDAERDLLRAAASPRGRQAYAACK